MVKLTAMKQNSDKKQLRNIITLFICLMSLTYGSIALAEFSYGGYCKNFFTTFKTPLPDRPLMGAAVNRLRLNLSYVPTDVISFAFAYDIAPRVQDPSLFSESPFAVGIASSNYRVIDFDSLLYPNADSSIGSVGIYHNLDRASLQISTDFADISIGRDAVAWGSARVINPTDVVAPYTHDQLDTEDRVGVDAFRVRIPIGVLGEVDTGYIFGTDFHFDRSAIFLRTQMNAAETDFSMLLMELQRDLLIGLDVTRGILGAGFWLETAYVLTDAFVEKAESADNYLRTSVGLDYSFNGKTYTFIEYHYNGAGTDNPDNYLNNIDQSAYTRGGVYLLGVHYLAPGINHQLTPLVGLGGQLLINLTDPSIWLAPNVAYNIAEDIHLSVGGLISFGSAPTNGDSPQFQSEFGSYPNLFFTSISVYY